MALKGHAVSRCVGGIWLLLASARCNVSAPPAASHPSVVATESVRNARSPASLEASHACAPRVIVDVDGPVDALASSGAEIFAVLGERGTIVAVSTEPAHGGAVRIVSSSEHNPFAIIIRKGRPVWASLDGLVEGIALAQGVERRQLATTNDISAIASAEDGTLYFATTDPPAIWLLELDGTRKRVVGPQTGADELLVQDRWVVWTDRNVGSVSSYDTVTHRLAVLGRDQRRPHDLSGADAHVRWHEGEADLLPGRAAESFVADLATRHLERVREDDSAPSRVLLRANALYGEARCKRVTDSSWQRLDDGEGAPPVADDRQRWYWTTILPGGRWRVWSADKAMCCAQEEPPRRRDQQP
ncbi:MAG: hypothetical protein FWD17_07415 [Polyangiaceae bacterium]|nr:hypothetical protein [Polyangiaceae bacterium]